MSKFKNLSPADIDSKVKSGDYIKDEMVIREKSTMQIVKLEKVSKHESETYPNSYFQVNNNYIYQFDIADLFSKIKVLNLNLNIEKLSDEYNTVLDFISMHNDIEDFSDNIYALIVPLARSFESMIKKIASEFSSFSSQDLSDESVDRLLNVLKAYVNILFSYSIFLVIKNKNSSSVRSVIDIKISTLREIILPIYEEILLPYKNVRNEYSNKLELKPDFSESLYIEHYSNADYEIKNLEFLIDFDRRFTSVSSLLNEAKENKYCLGFKQSPNSRYNVNGKDKRKNFAYGIYLSFVDISKLEQFITEFGQLDLNNDELKQSIFERLH